MRISKGKPTTPCGACPLAVVGSGFVQGDGPLPSSILIVGEAPGETEAKTGKPFVGQAGKLLDKLLKRAGIERSMCRVANVICCRPPSNALAGAPYEHEAIGACSPLLEEEIKKCQPKVIVALGATAFRRLTGLTGITRYRGFPIRHPSGAWIVPTFHPSFLLPRPGQKDTVKLTGVVTLDLRKVKDILEHGFSKLPTHYLLDPTPTEAEVFAAEYEQALIHGTTLGLSADIETPGKLAKGEAEDEENDEYGSTQILRISFCFKPGYSMSIPWQPQYMNVIRRLLENPDGAIIFWNGYAFDRPILELNGIKVSGIIYDAMWAWHLLQSDLPRGLESVTSHYAYDIGAWKHYSESEPARYNAIDADAAYRNFAGIKKDLEARGMWQLYLDHVVALAPFLFTAGREHGVLIDLDAQQALREQLHMDRTDLLREAQLVTPKALWSEKIYQRLPKAIPETEFEEIPTVKAVRVCTICGKENVSKTHFTSKKSTCGSGEITYREQETTAYQWRPDFARLDGEELVDAVAAAGFNPVSTKQLIGYAKYYRHEIGENYKTGREQLDKKVRAKLIKEYGKSHPIYDIAQEAQEVTKTLGTYVDGYRPDGRGRIYTAYTFAPSTGRLSSRNVNLQNASRGSNNRYATAIRRTIIPGPGHVFVEADSSAIEAVMTGWFMEDPEYIRLAKQGIHDYITCLEFGLPFNPDELGTYRKDPLYEEARERNKRVVHGTNYGMTPKMMVMAYPDHFTDERMAAFSQARYFKACPKLPKWQQDIRTLAHRQSYLQNPWGYRHYFYEVFTRNAKGEVVLGNDGKRVVAFLPQSSAAAFMRDSLLLLAASPWAKYAPANVSIHDSICLAVPEDRAEDAMEYLLQMMTRPIEKMSGLVIGAECKIGPNWADMKKVGKR